MASVIIHSSAHPYRISSAYRNSQEPKAIRTSHCSEQLSSLSAPLVARHRANRNNQIKIQPYKKRRTDPTATTSQSFSSVAFAPLPHSSQLSAFASMGPWPTSYSNQGFLTDEDQYSQGVYQSLPYNFQHGLYQGGLTSPQGSTVLERPVVPSQKIIGNDPSENPLLEADMSGMGTIAIMGESAQRGSKGKGRERLFSLPPLPLDNRQYQLSVDQQPLHARMCGFGEKDRRPIDPPPIVQLLVADEYGKPDSEALQNNFYVLHVTLWSENCLEERNLIANPPKYTRVLMGTLVSSPNMLKNPSDEQGLYFAFPDLSIRTEGRYTLKFTLLKLGEAGGLFPTPSPILTFTFSNPFTVYSAKKFPGMTESTDLSKTFAKQGLKIPIRNEVRGKKSE